MLAGVISRDEGCPWGTSGQTSATWKKIPTRTVVIKHLWATQPGILFDAIIRPEAEAVGGDSFPHVIEWDGKMYLEDGHHRVVRAALAGRTTIEVRYLIVNNTV